MREHEGVKYKIEPIEVEIATGRHSEHCETKWGYTYTILNACETYNGYDDHESDEWYDSENEAVIAAEHMIDTLQDGDVEPDYDVQPYGQIDWDERRRMGE